ARAEPPRYRSTRARNGRHSGRTNLRTNSGTGSHSPLIVIKLLSSFFLTHRFFYAWFSVAALYVFAFVFPALSFVSLAAFAALLLLTVVDGIMLFYTTGVRAKRFLPEKFSNGDVNPTSARIDNHYAFKIKASLIDELPAQF